MKRPLFLSFPVAISILTVSCTPDPELYFDESEGSGPIIAPNSTIYAVQQASISSEKEVYTFPVDVDMIVETTVISSDEAGNFYKNIVLIDSKEELPYGIQVKIDMRAYFTLYERGRIVLLNVSGLSIRHRDGSFELGYRINDQLKEIPAALIDKHLNRTSRFTDLVSRTLRSDELDQSMINTLVRAEGFQFQRQDLGKTFAGEVFDSYYALRQLEGCDNTLTLAMSTSTYADFGSQVVPDGTFNAEGILSRDYSGQLCLIINDTDQIVLLERDRCDQISLKCDPEVRSGIDLDVIFHEDFEAVGSTREIEEKGWLNFNANYRNGKFAKRSSDNNTYVRVSSYGSQEEVMEVWLISPEIDLEESEQEVLTFRTRATFNKGRLLTIWVSENFEAIPEDAQWTLLDAVISDGTDDGNNERFVTSNPVDLSCLKGSINIGFRYLGGDPAPSTTYDIDDVLVRGRRKDSNLKTL